MSVETQAKVPTLILAVVVFAAVVGLALGIR
jgi:hypothetical protein